MKVIAPSLVAACAMIVGLPSLAAQTALVDGIVRSSSGVALSGVRVEALPGGASVQTGASGTFRLDVPSGTALRLALAGLGYGPDTLDVAPIAAHGRRTVAVTLTPLYLLAEVRITSARERPLLNTDDAATGGAIEAAELAALPTDARNPLALLYNLPGVTPAAAFFGDAPPLSIDGGNALYTPYLLDGLDNTEGFLGGPRVEVPLGGLARERALVNTYSSEFGRSPGGIVDQTSRAGADSAHGDAFAFYRPGRPFDAGNKVPFGADPAAIDAQQAGFHRVQLGGGVNGPIARGGTYGAAAAEYSDEREDRIGSTARATFVGTEQRRKVKLLGRLDHQWNASQVTTLRVAFSDVNRAGQGSGIVTPEADVTTRRIGSLTALVHRSVFAAGRATHYAAIQLGTFRWFFPPARGAFDRPQVTILAGADSSVQAVVGASNFIFDETERQFQIRDWLELAPARGHALRIGADVLTSGFQLAAAGTNPLGSYVVFNDGNVSPSSRFYRYEDIPADVRVRSYTVDASPVQVNLRQTNWGAYVEDRWRASASLTIQAGLRWDYDDITSRGSSTADLNNFQPRASANWRRGASVFRAGAGIYTGRFPYAIYSDAAQFGPAGNATVTFDDATGGAPGLGQGPAPAELQQRRDLLPAREIRQTFALGLQQPAGYQGTLGYAAQLGDKWAISLDGVIVDTRHLPRSFDLNPITRPLAPADTVDRTVAFGDSLRPVTPTTGSYRRLTTTESGGRSRYLGLYVSVRRRLSASWALDANWVWSRARNDTEDINFNAVAANDYDAEYADAANDRRHRVTLRSVSTIARRIRLGVIGDFQTGQPVNRVAGTINADGSVAFRDLDGSGGIFGEGFIGSHDRFPGVPRNGERLPSFFNLGTSVTYLLALGGNALEVRADAFNLLNGTEWAGFATGLPGGGSRTQVGRPGDPTVLRAAGPPRQVQFSATYRF